MEAKAGDKKRWSGAMLAFAPVAPLRHSPVTSVPRRRATAMLSDVSRAYIFQASPYRAARSALSAAAAARIAANRAASAPASPAEAAPAATPSREPPSSARASGDLLSSPAPAPATATGPTAASSSNPQQQQQSHQHQSPQGQRPRPRPRPRSRQQGADDKAAALAELYAALERDSAGGAGAGGSGDPLREVGGRFVGARGSACARLAIVGEAPGEQEDLQGAPFVGRAGQLLDKIFRYGGFDMDGQVYVTNVVKRRPPGNRTPTAAEVAYYLPFLRAELDIVNPAVVVLAGSVAARAVLGDARARSVTRVRGQWFRGRDIVWLAGADKGAGKSHKEEQEEEEHKEQEQEEEGLGEAWVMPVFHPSYLLRMPIKKFEMVTDIHAIREKYLQVEPDDPLRPLDVNSRAS